MDHRLGVDLVDLVAGSGLDFHSHQDLQHGVSDIQDLDHDLYHSQDRDIHFQEDLAIRSQDLDQYHDLAQDSRQDQYLDLGLSQDQDGHREDHLDHRLECHLDHQEHQEDHRLEDRSRIPLNFILILILILT